MRGGCVRIYWHNEGNKRAEILGDIGREGAQPWGSTEPKSHILVGNGKIFIHPPDYHIDGYSLTTEELEDLLRKLRDRTPV